MNIVGSFIRAVSPSLVDKLQFAEGLLRPDINGVVLYVFPMRWSILLDDAISHIQRVPVPMLFVQGGRDDLTDLRELRPFLADLGGRASLRAVGGADQDTGWAIPPDHRPPVELRRRKPSSG